MVIRASEEELDLSGSPAELRGIARAIRSLQDGERCSFVADIRALASPYDRVLSLFEVVASRGPVCIVLAGNTLVAEGSLPMLKCLASFFDFSDSDRHGTHHHHEWWEGNDYVSPVSRPLVISVA